MNMKQIRERAQALRVPPGDMKKKALIHAIQKTEGYTECYGKFGSGCPYMDCCWRSDCRREK